MLLGLSSFHWTWKSVLLVLVSEKVTVTKIYASVVDGKEWLNVFTCLLGLGDTTSLLLIFFLFS